VYLAENTFRLLKGLFYIAASIGNFFGKIWEFSPDFDTINRLQILLLILGFAFTLWAGYLISKRTSDKENELQQSMIAIGFTAFVYFMIGVKILTLPII
jgi:membrane protein insertase Oxa1/YidC/SpoIIIJ